MYRVAFWLLSFMLLGSQAGWGIEGRWVLTGAPATIRAGHTATLLTSGKVLMVGGGFGDAVPAANAELYDPATATWSPTGLPQVPRTLHTATLLPSGKVLVVGGFNGALGGSLTSVEIYDPATGIWSSTGSLEIPRFSHTATLLPSGRVLVVGGYDAIISGIPHAIASAELYDPATGTWSATGTLLTARAEHTATLLRSGQVLVTGGSGGQIVFASTELFDSSTNRWTSTGPLNSRRYQHSATLLPSGQVLVVGGRSSTASLNLPTRVDLYDPSSGEWSMTADLSSKRYQHSAILLSSGKVLVVGGSNGSSPLDPNCVLYDPVARTWAREADVFIPEGFLSLPTTTLLPSGDVLLVGGSGIHNAQVYEPFYQTPPSPTGGSGYRRTKHTLTLLPTGRVLVVGGGDDGKVLASAEIYDPVTNTWGPTGSLSEARQNHTATLLPSGKVLVAGGDAGKPRGFLVPLQSAEIYDPATGEWQPTGSMLTSRGEHTATLLSSGRVLVAGGVNPNPTYAAEIYDPASGSWSTTGSMIWERSRHTATLLLSGKVLVAGGNGGNAEIYDPDTGSWTVTGSLLLPRSLHTATLLPSGRVLVAGGYGYAHLSEAEMYDPTVGVWFPLQAMASPRAEHEAVLLPSGKVLVAGGWDGTPGLVTIVEVFDPASGWASAGSVLYGAVQPGAALLPSGQVLFTGGAGAGRAEILSPGAGSQDRKPIITSVSPTIRFGVPFEIAGQRFRGDSESSTGGTGNSATNHPLVQMIAVEGQHRIWLTPDPRQSFWDDPMTLTVSHLPATISPGWYLLSVTTAGNTSEAKLVSVACSIAITSQPEDRTAQIGGSATFVVETQGARSFQWQKDGVDIPGATSPTYTTPPVTGADSGTRYQVRVGSGCTSTTSLSATLTVEDHAPPQAAVISPGGGEYWLLSAPGSPNTQVVTWSMSDDIRVCQVRVSLLYSRDGGASYQEAPAAGGLPATFGPGGTCAFPGPAETALSYTVPVQPPAGTAGALYKIQVRVTDQAGLVTTVASLNPFYIVQPNPDSVRTLILANTARMQVKMGISPAQAAAVEGKLRELADHPRVLGFVVDLNGITDLSHSQTGLYAAWDADAGNAEKANRVLLGCHAPLPAGCVNDKKGVRDVIRDLLQVYSGVKYVVLVGDDRIIPLARLSDSTSLLPESLYPSGGALSTNGTTVGQALASDHYLSDDPLVFLGTLSVDDLQGNGNGSERAFLPDLAVGRLVETPEEIITTIATFISQDGILDLSQLDSINGHKVLVTGYDFLLDSGRIIRKRWKNALHIPPPHDDSSLAPVDGQLLTADWGSTTIPERRRILKSHLGGNGGGPYAISILNGHATHYQEGVPGTHPFDIQGVEASDLYGGDQCGAPPEEPLGLSGGVVFALGCHGGLPVAGSCAQGSDHSLDLPQTFLARGVVVYVANTGYAWGLLHGVGYSERLMEILTEEMTRTRVIVAGEAVQRAKLRYFLEAPRVDPYDEKTLMQWTLFGLPMYSVRIDAGTTASPLTSVLAVASMPGSRERFGPVAIERQTTVRTAEASSLPSFLTRLDLHFDFTASGVYTKRNALGEALGQVSGCPDPPSGEPPGCYYTLNGLVERATGVGDLPIQPYFVYESRLSGTSQHGVLWKGGTFDQESGWIPVLGELISNGASSSDHGSAPRHVILKPQPRRRPLGGDAPQDCRTSDLEVSSLVIPAGEALKAEVSDAIYSIQRRYREIDLEAFFFNNSFDAESNCDRTGPELLPGPYGGAYHRVLNGTLEWSIPAVDDAGVWRVVVVYNDQSSPGQSSGAWVPIELAEDDGLWTGSLDVLGISRLTYVVQAVDRRGNVTWLDYVADEVPESGVDLDLPSTIDVSVMNGESLDNNAPLSGSVSGSEPDSAWRYYFVDLESGSTQLGVDLFALSANADLFVRRGEQPDRAHFDCAANGTPASPAHCLIANPSAGRWWIGVNSSSVGIVSFMIRAAWELPAANDFHTIAPCRLFDTRDSQPLISGVSRSFQITGTCGIPDAARAVSVNVTVVSPLGAGHLTLYPDGAAVPFTSTINFQQYQVRANNAILRLSSAGALGAMATISGGGSVELILDVNGYFQ